jgi:polar amino acid transport system substrate-binding protein
MRWNHWIPAALIGLILGGCATAVTPPTALQRTLAPGGKLRVGVNFGAPSSAIRDANTGELTGVAHDLGKELARRLNVPFEPVLYRRSAEVIAALKTGDIDAAFVTLTAARAKEIDFSSPYLQIEKGALVPGDTRAKTLADIDQPGMRVAVLGGGTADITLSSEFRTAAIVRALSVDDGIDLLRAGKADAFVSQKTILFEMSRRLARSRVLDGRLGVELHAIAIPKGREAGLDFIQAFAADARNSGMVGAFIEKARLQGASVYHD